MDTVTQEQLAEWRRLCDEWNSEDYCCEAGEDDIWEFIHAARAGWPATMDALEAVTAERDQLAKRLELAGGYHARTEREIELEEMLNAFPAEERDSADHAIADLLQLVDAGRNRLHETECKFERAERENTHLRAALATSKDPCVYCQLPAEEMSKCKAGFPGCARMDDLMGCPELGASLENDELRRRVKELETTIGLCSGSCRLPEGASFE